MNKNVKIAAVLVVVVAAGVLVSAKTNLFQGRLSLKDKHCAVVAYDCSKLYNYNSKIVSGVASPVSSVVASKVSSSVASKGGTSQVASNVASVVTSSVASGVSIPEKDAKGVDTKKLKNLDSKLLESIAKDAMRRNPRAFTLSSDEKQRILDLYTNTSRATKRR